MDRYDSSQAPFPAGDSKCLQNFHTHTRWCDGKDTPRDMIEASLAKGFSTLGFSSHAMLPAEREGNLSTTSAPQYFAEVRALAAEYADRIALFCGVEADHIPGLSSADRAAYRALEPDYVIGSVHTVVAPDGAEVPVDHTPDLLRQGLIGHFGNDAEAFIRAYFRQERDMALTCDFDIIGHPDLVRKFNGVLSYFNETAPWYQEELRLTADAFARSGKVVEVNTGAISRGWMTDAYPSPFFRSLLRARGIPFILSSDAHAAAAIDCAFDRFAAAETWCDWSPRKK